MVSLRGITHLALLLSKSGVRKRLTKSLHTESRRILTLERANTPENTPFFVRNNPGGVSLRYWDQYQEQGVGNFGDLLSPVICSYLAKELCDADFSGPATHPTVMYALGSLLGAAAEDAVVWGTGLDYTIHPVLIPTPSAINLDIRAVRGPITAAFMRYLGFNCPSVYGDPAVLLPSVYQPKELPLETWQVDTGVTKPEITPSASHAKDSPGRRVLVIQHHKGRNLLVELNHTQQQAAAKHNTVWRSAPVQIGNDIVLAASAWTADWRGIVDLIASADLVVSSAMHGIIVAEAYGVPAVQLLDSPSAGMKFDDYYLSTGRTSWATAKTVKEALALGAPSLPDLEPQRKALLESFPKDLWNA